MHLDAIYSEGLMFERSDFEITELPPVPEDFQKELEELGGYCNGFPNVRIVSGMDPEHVEFYGGKFWRKYAFREHNRKEYYTYTTPDQKKKILTVAEGKVYEKSPKLLKNGVLIPVIEHNVIEHGIPRYFVELYKPPIAFGSQEDWNLHRYMMPDDPNNFTGEFIDMLGEYPENGLYETWFCIEEPIEENGKVVSTAFKAIDDEAKEFIRYMVETIKQRKAADVHRELVDEGAKTYLKEMEQMQEGVKEIVADRFDRLVGTPKSYGTGKEYDNGNSSQEKAAEN